MTSFADISIAYFISAHGLGHAARAAAVMAAVQRDTPTVRFEIFTTVPHWFFSDCLTGPFACHGFRTDVGLVQTTPLKEDLPATLAALDTFYPLDNQAVNDLAGKLKALDCRMVVCDIAPLGIAVARRAGLPSVLVENFTWDWIYAGYPEYGPGFQSHTDYLHELFFAADYHVQASPVCVPGSPDLTVPPVSRTPRLPAGRIRRQLDIPDYAKLVVITLGGTATAPGQLCCDRLPEDVFLVIPGGTEEVQRLGPVLSLPICAGVYHPDLIRAADAVIGKNGYSTLAEVYHADVPFGFVSRPDFREAPVLETFVCREMRSVKVADTALRDGSWTAALPALFSLPPSGARQLNGAARIAAFIPSVLHQ